MPLAENNVGKIGWYDRHGDRYLDYNAMLRAERLYEMQALLRAYRGG